jgi:hypothetical protein
MNLRRPKTFLVVTIDELAPEEPLSPELVLVLPPELRAAALARLPLPVWPEARPRTALGPPRAKRSPSHTVATLLLSRVAQLMLIFLSVSALVLILAAVANAVR